MHSLHIFLKFFYKGFRGNRQCDHNSLLVCIITICTYLFVDLYSINDDLCNTPTYSNCRGDFLWPDTKYRFNSETYMHYCIFEAICNFKHLNTKTLIIKNGQQHNKNLSTMK